MQCTQVESGPGSPRDHANTAARPLLWDQEACLLSACALRMPPEPAALRAFHSDWTGPVSTGPPKYHTRFLSPGMLTFGARQLLWGLPWSHGVSGSTLTSTHQIPGASPPAVTTRSVSRRRQVSPGTESPRLRAAVLGAAFEFFEVGRFKDPGNGSRALLWNLDGQAGPSI